MENTEMLSLQSYSLLMLVLLCGEHSQHATVEGFAITNGHCQKNISVKYTVPVTKTRTATPNELIPGSNVHTASSSQQTPEQFVHYEERVRWDTVQVCCPGYRTIIFGFCEPICRESCPSHSYCTEPNKCVCMHGYESSHHPNKQHQLICRPICQGGCPEHSHCVAHNECVCRPGYKDISSWFSPVLCERIQCGMEQRYDVLRRACIKIDMSVEELMQRVAERLAKGLDTTEREPTDIDEDTDDERVLGVTDLGN